MGDSNVIAEVAPQDIVQQPPESYLGSWVPVIDDLWDAVERVKENFSRGVFKGLEQTLQDALFWIASWRIWQTTSVREWFCNLLQFGELS